MCFGPTYAGFDVGLVGLCDICGSLHALGASAEGDRCHRVDASEEGGRVV